jgi:hypothetical protein
MEWPSLPKSIFLSGALEPGDETLRSDAAELINMHDRRPGALLRAFKSSTNWYARNMIAALRSVFLYAGQVGEVIGLEMSTLHFKLLRFHSSLSKRRGFSWTMR